MRKTREAERKRIYAELVEVMQDFRSKAGHGDLRRLVRMVGMTERAFRAIEVGERSTTRKRLNQSRLFWLISLTSKIFQNGSQNLSQKSLNLLLVASTLKVRQKRLNQAGKNF